MPCRDEQIDFDPEIERKTRALRKERRVAREQVLAMAEEENHN